MITWIKRTHYENKVKLAFYKTIANLLAEQNDIIAFISRLYTALKDTPVEELKSEFIAELAEIIHQSAEKERTGNE